MPDLTWTIDNMQIKQVVELPAGELLQSMTAAGPPDTIRDMGGFAPHFADENGVMKGWIQSFVVTVGGKTYFIEGGAGNGRPRTSFTAWDNLQTDFMERMTTQGIDPETVDYVLSSHLHMDHIGWFTQAGDNGDWVPTFPNARYIIVQEAYNLWHGRETNPDQMAAFKESVEPVVTAGLVDFVDNKYQLNDHMKLIPTPGHTPHHVAIQFTSGGQTALFPGDVFPHPAHIIEPTWAFASDFDPAGAVTTR
ncbi:MAG: MBL fold metallo-hydrolase, partial [Chloroflexota bacterium]